MKAATTAESVKVIRETRKAAREARKIECEAVKAAREARDRLINKRYWENPTVNLRDVAQEFNMTRQRIHQIISQDSPFAPPKANARELAMAEKYEQLDIVNNMLKPHQRNNVTILAARTGIITKVIYEWLASKDEMEPASVGVLASKTTQQEDGIRT